MKKSFWAYQKRADKTPWVINAILEFPRGHREKAAITFDIYSDKIDNSVHCTRINKRRYMYLDDAIGALIDVINAYSIITKEDELQLQEFVTHILHERKNNV